METRVPRGFDPTMMLRGRITVLAGVAAVPTILLFQLAWGFLHTTLTNS